MPQTVEIRISIGVNQWEAVMRISKEIVGLRQQIHDDLRRQHPESVLPNGESPTCDVYEARLIDLLAIAPSSQTTPDQIVIVP